MNRAVTTRKWERLPSRGSGLSMKRVNHPSQAAVEMTLLVPPHPPESENVLLPLKRPPD